MGIGLESEGVVTGAGEGGVGAGVPGKRPDIDGGLIGAGGESAGDGAGKTWREIEVESERLRGGATGSWNLEEEARNGGMGEVHLEEAFKGDGGRA